VLKCTKDQILVIDTPGQHVPPCVRYGTACLLIRNGTGSVSCSVDWGLTSYFVTYFVKRLTHMVQEGPFVGEIIVDLCNGM
jgi:hypothetical protein